MKSWIKKKKTNVEADSEMLANPAAMPVPQAGAVSRPGSVPVAGVPSPYAGAQIRPQIVAGQSGVPMAPTPRPYGAPAAPTSPQPMPAQGMPPQAMPAPAQVARQAMPRQAMPMHTPIPQQPMLQHAMQGQPMPPQGMAPQGMQMPTMAAPAQAREEGEVALPAISIHAFCDRPETASTIQATTRDWRMARTNLKVYMGGLPAAVEFYHNENTPSLVLIESGMRGAELFGQLESLASVCDSNTKVVVIGASNDIRLYRELMDKGVSDYLVPPFHPLSLIRSLSDLYVDPEQPFIGRVAAFFGAKGGVGSSTIAHNIAWALSDHMSQETALVDLDSSWGTTGLDFNYDNVQGLEEALASPDRLDETLLDRIMIRHTSTLSLLPAGASLNNASMDNSEAYEAIVSGVRKISPLTILDLPHHWTEWTSQVLTMADDVVITATPDLANLRNTKNLVEYLRTERPNDAEPILILNKTGVPKTPEIPVKDFATALGLEPALVLPFEPIIYAQAANDGKMLSEMKSDSKAIAGFDFLAERLRTGSFESNGKTALKRGGKRSLLSKLKKKK